MLSSLPDINLEAVKIKLPEITSLFRKFAEAQYAYHVALTDEGQRQDLEVYFAEIKSRLDFFCRTVNDWLRVTLRKRDFRIIWLRLMTMLPKLKLVFEARLNPASADLGQADSLKQALYQLQEPKRHPVKVSN